MSKHIPVASEVVWKSVVQDLETTKLWSLSARTKKWASGKWIWALKLQSLSIYIEIYKSIYILYNIEIYVYCTGSDPTGHCCVSVTVYIKS